MLSNGFFTIPDQAVYYRKWFAFQRYQGLQWDDSTGFLWIATEAGVVRYNGMSFKVFDIKSNPELGSNRIIKLVKNSDGRMLVAGEYGNISLVKDNTVAL